MNIVDVIVTVVLLTPLFYGWYHYHGRVTSDVADQTVRVLSNRSRLEAARQPRPEVING